VKSYSGSSLSLPVAGSEVDALDSTADSGSTGTN